jgi:macrolide resistance protein
MVARDALVPRVAREDDVPLVRATSLRETLQNTAQFVGPLAAGLERQRLGHDQPLTAASALADVRQGFRFIVSEPLLGPLTWLLVAWVAVYVPLSTLIFPAWFNFARESAGALGLFLGVQALGGVLCGLAFAAVGPKVSKFRWFVATEVVATALLAALLATEPGSAAAVALSFGVGLVGAGSLPIINTAYYSRTPEELLGRVNGTSFAMVLTVLPFSSLALGWLVNATAPARER